MISKDYAFAQKESLYLRVYDQTNSIPNFFQEGFFYSIYLSDLCLNELIFKVKNM